MWPKLYDNRYFIRQFFPLKSGNGTQQRLVCARTDMSQRTERRYHNCSYLYTGRLPGYWWQLQLLRYTTAVAVDRYSHLSCVKQGNLLLVVLFCLFTSLRSCSLVYIPRRVSVCRAYRMQRSLITQIMHCTTGQKLTARRIQQ